MKFAENPNAAPKATKRIKGLFETTSRSCDASDAPRSSATTLTVSIQTLNTFNTARIATEPK